LKTGGQNKVESAKNIESKHPATEKESDTHRSFPALKETFSGAKKGRRFGFSSAPFGPCFFG